MTTTPWKGQPDLDEIQRRIGEIQAELENLPPGGGERLDQLMCDLFALQALLGVGSAPVAEALPDDYFGDLPEEAGYQEGHEEAGYQETGDDEALFGDDSAELD